MASKIPSKLMVELIEKILENDTWAHEELTLFNTSSECSLITWKRTQRALRQALKDGGYTVEEFDLLTQQPEFEGSWAYGGLKTYLEDSPRREHV